MGEVYSRAHRDKYLNDLHKNISKEKDCTFKTKNTRILFGGNKGEIFEYAIEKKIHSDLQKLKSP